MEPRTYHWVLVGRVLAAQTTYSLVIIDWACVAKIDAKFILLLEDALLLPHVVTSLLAVKGWHVKVEY